jgi:hypothetical protein
MSLINYCLALRQSWTGLCLDWTGPGGGGGGAALDTTGPHVPTFGLTILNIEWLDLTLLYFKVLDWIGMEWIELD